MWFDTHYSFLLKKKPHTTYIHYKPPVLGMLNVCDGGVVVRVHCFRCALGARIKICLGVAQEHEVPARVFLELARESTLTGESHD